MLRTSELNKRKLKETIEKLSTETDSLGTKIDPGIIITVALLNMHGFSTSSSCEGHIDRAMPYGWIRFQTATEAAERALHKNGTSIYYLLNQETCSAAEQKTIVKFGDEKNWTDEAEEFYGQTLRDTLRKHVNYHHYTDVFEKIRSERKKLHEKVIDFFHEFILFQQDRITISETGSVKISFASENEISFKSTDLSLQQRKVLNERSKKSISLLTEFLKYSF